jgi:branched-chain amino acid transport system substrate-binding protein
LLVAACTRTEAPQTGPRDEVVTVTIGHAGPLTGSIAHQGKDDENGVALAIEQANAKNLRIGGKDVRFRMMSEDDQGDPKLGTLVAQKLVDAKVAAVIGHLNSGVTIPASEIYTRAGIPVISGSATNPDLTERGLKGVFRTVGRDDQQGPAIAAYIAGDLKGKHVAIVDDRPRTAKGSPPRSSGRSRARAWAWWARAHHRQGDRLQGDPHAHQEPQCRRGVPRRMDATGGLMVKQAREIGLKSQFAFGDGACTTRWRSWRSGGRGARVLAGGHPGECREQGFPRRIQQEVRAHEAVRAFLLRRDQRGDRRDAARDSVDPAKFTPEIYKTSLQGATGRIEFDAKGDRKNAEMTIFRMQGGKIVPIAIYRDGKMVPFTQ